MSEDAPTPPPESSDPYEVLGVSYSDDEKAVRRAYVRLIRVWRPERHPEVFQRIHEAYDQIRDDLKYERATSTPPSTPPSAAQLPDLEEDDAEQLAQVWRALADGHEARADELFATFANRTVRKDLVSQHRFLITEFRHGARVAAAPLLEALERGEDVAVMAEQFLSGPELREHALAPVFAWERLSSLPNRRAAARLFQLRVDEGLRHGDYEALASEVESPAFEEDAEDTEALQNEVHRIAAALAWRDPERAGALMTRWPVPSQLQSDSWMPHDHYSQALEHGAGYRMWRKQRERPAALMRYLEVAPVLPTATVGPIAQGLPSKRDKADPAWIAHLVELERAAPTIGSYLALAAGLERTPERRLRPDVTDRAVDLARHYNPRACRGASIGTINVFKWVTMILGGGAIARAFDLAWFIRLGIYTAIYFVFSVIMSRALKHRYDRHVRHMFGLMVASLDLHPSMLADWLEKEPPATSELRRYVEPLREDHALHAVWALQGVAELGRTQQRT